MIVYIIIFLSAILFYTRCIKPFSYWKTQGVASEKGWPIFGSLAPFNFGFVALADWVDNMYHSYNSRYFGLYQTTIPTLIIKDVELIKQLAIKDFDHFTDHRGLIPEESDPVFGRNLFSIGGQKWKNMRSTLSPAFTGSKMRMMFDLISEISKQFTSYFEHDASTDNTIVIEWKEAVARFANDVIASTAFGIEVNSLKEKDNEFYKMGKSILDFAGKKSLIISGWLTVPRLMELMKIYLFFDEERNFFKYLVLDNMSVREKKGIIRPDMINMLLQVKKGQLHHDDVENEEDGFATVQESHIGRQARDNQIELTDEDYVAQALIFFLAGFDTVSTGLCYMAYELALNPDIQQRLLEEIENVKEMNGGKFTYDAVVKMKYLDMVISESLRKWPPVGITDRVCTSPYTIQPNDSSEKPLKLRKKDVVWIPIHSIHRDEKYYPNPNKFDPERFNDENKRNINPLAYLPFGAGPRSCIGSRLALLESKVFFCHLLTKFEIVVTEKTAIPIRFAKKFFGQTPEGGLWLGLKLRK